MRHFLLTIMRLVFATLSFSQVHVPTNVPTIDLSVFVIGLAKVLPLSGTYGGYTMSADKDPVPAIILLPGEDSTRKILPISSMDKESRFSNDVKILCQNVSIIGFVVERPVEMQVIELGNQKWVPCFDFQSHLEAGNIIRLLGRYLIFPIADAKTKLTVKKFRYDFGENATISWDNKNQTAIWRGFTVKVE